MVASWPTDLRNRSEADLGRRGRQAMIDELTSGLQRLTETFLTPPTTPPAGVYTDPFATGLPGGQQSTPDVRRPATPSVAMPTGQPQEPAAPTLSLPPIESYLGGQASGTGYTDPFATGLPTPDTSQPGQYQLPSIESFLGRRQPEQPGLATSAGLPSSPASAVPSSAAGDRPGAPLVAMSGTYSGDRNGKLALIGDIARQSGLDDEGARILQAVAVTEGGLEGAIGDNGQSFGPYQFYTGGQLQGFAKWLGVDIETAKQKAHDPVLATQYAATTYLGKAIRDGRAQGLSGAALATYVQRYGQVSINPEKTGANYQSLFGNGQDPFAGARQGQQTASTVTTGEQPTPGASERAPVAGAPAQFASSDYSPSQFDLGLTWEEAVAACGPAAAIAFARRNGRNPTGQEALALAREVGWTPQTGMRGTQSQVQLLGRMGIAAKMEEGVNWEKVRADVLAGNPVIFDTTGGSGIPAGHYFVVQGYDPNTGRYDLGGSARALKASGGKQWYTPAEIVQLGAGSPRNAIYMDNPGTPQPSVVAGQSSPQAQTITTPRGTVDETEIMAQRSDVGAPQPDPGFNDPGPVPLPPPPARDDWRNPRPATPVVEQPVRDPLLGQPDASGYGQPPRPTDPWTAASVQVDPYATPPAPPAGPFVPAPVRGPSLAGGVTPAATPTFTPPPPAPAYSDPFASGVPQQPPRPTVASDDPNAVWTSGAGVQPDDRGLNIPGAVGRGLQRAWDESPIDVEPPEAVRGTPLEPVSRVQRAINRAGFGLLSTDIVAKVLQEVGKEFGLPTWQIAEGFEIGLTDVLALPGRAGSAVSQGGARAATGAAADVAPLITQRVLGRLLPENVVRAIAPTAEQYPAFGQTVLGALPAQGVRAARAGAEAVAPAVRDTLDFLGEVGRGMREAPIGNTVRNVGDDIPLSGDEGFARWLTDRGEIERVRPGRGQGRRSGKQVQGVGQSEVGYVGSRTPPTIERDRYAFWIRPGTVEGLEVRPYRTYEEAQAALREFYDQNVAQESPGIVQRAGQFAREVGQAAQDAPIGNRTFYHGTAGAFDAPDPARFSEHGLYGPGYYLTESPEVASNYAATRGELAVTPEDVAMFRERLKNPRLSPEARAEYERVIAQVEGEGGAGPNVRVVDVPDGVRLFDNEVPVSPREARAIERAASVELGSPFRLEPYARASGGAVRTALYEETGDMGAVNRILNAAGFDGIRGRSASPENGGFGGGEIVIFPESLPKITNRFSGTPMGAGPTPTSTAPSLAARTTANAMAGATAGASGEVIAATQEEREVDPARFWGGAAGGAALGVLAGRRGGRAGVGNAVEDVGRRTGRTVAYGADPNTVYQFRVKVVDLGDLVTSHTDTLQPNPKFPQELQPRLRDRAGSRLQIDKIAQTLNPDALLTDVQALDRGPMIVGADNIVESGNGRTMALRAAAIRYPDQYAAYAERLRAMLPEYGLDESALQGVRHPVLVRERLTPVERAAFAAEANQATVLGMSPFEQALQDARRVSDELVSALTVGDNQTIDQALRAAGNRDVIRRFLQEFPDNERAQLLDQAGNLNAAGLQRLKLAIFARTYPGEAGDRLTRTFSESIDPVVRNVENALFGSLPDVGRAEALIRSGQRDAGLSIADDIATAINVLARLKENGESVADYVAQIGMFGKETTPFQDELLQFLAASQRRPSTIRETLREYARLVENQADPDQIGMFGDDAGRASKGELFDAAIRTREADNAPPGLFAEAEARSPVNPPEAPAPRADAEGPQLARAADPAPAPEPARPVTPPSPEPEPPVQAAAAPRPSTRPPIPASPWGGRQPMLPDMPPAAPRQPAVATPPSPSLDPAQVAAEAARGAQRGVRLNQAITPPGTNVPIGRRLAAAVTDDRAVMRWAEDILTDLTNAPRLAENAAERPSTLSRVNADGIALGRVTDELAPVVARAQQRGALDELAQFLEDAHQRDVLAEFYRRGYQEAIDAGQPVAAAEAAGQRAMRKRAGSNAGYSWEAVNTRLAGQEQRLRDAGLLDEVNDLAAQVWEHNRRTLERARDAGRVSQDGYDWLVSTYPRYVPTVPISQLDPSGGARFGGGTAAGRVSADRANVIRAFDDIGSASDRLNPIVASRNATITRERQIARNEVFQAFARLYDEALPTGAPEVLPSGGARRRVFEGEREVGGWVDGEWRTIRVPRPVAELLDVAATTGAGRTILDFWKQVTGAIVQSITAGNIAFAPVNLVRDFGDFAIRAASTTGGPQNLPPAIGAYARELGNALVDIAPMYGTPRAAVGAATGAAIGAATGDEDQSVTDRVGRAALGAVAGGLYAGNPARARRTGKAKDFLERGGGMGRQDAGWQAGQRWYRDVTRSGGFAFRSPSDVARFVTDLGGDLLGLRAVKAINERLELVPRAARMGLADEAGENATTAMVAGRDASIDFERGGWLIRQANGIVPFLNAGTQAGAQMARTFRDHPLAFTATMASTVAPLVLAAEAYNRSDPERARAYDDVPQYLKDQGLVVMLPWAGSDNRGQRPNYVWLPFGMGAPVAIAAREALANVPGLEPTAGRADTSSEAGGWERAINLADQVFSVLNPLKGETAGAMAASVIPPGFKQAIELNTNRDLFRGSQIATDLTDERASAFGRGAAGLANTVGRAIGSDALQEVRPSQIDYGLRQLPAYGNLVTGASDMLAPRPTKAEEDRPIQNAPFFGGAAGRLVRDTGGANLERARSGMLTDTVRDVIAEAGMRPSDVQGVPSYISYRGQRMPLERDDQAVYQMAYNRELAIELAELRGDPKWTETGEREKLVRQAMTRARQAAAREVLDRVPDPDSRVEREQRRRAAS